MDTDKRHYYDGIIYETFVDPAFKEIRNIIIKQIKKETNVIDICCGTGALVFELSKHCKSVIGVELSSKMVDYAKYHKQAKNINFIHGNATDLHDIKDHQFDYAIISMAIHEMPPDLRISVLQEAKQISKIIIIADYTTPQPYNFAGISVRIIEFIAGIEHFKGFRNFQKNNGLDQLLKDCNLSICNEIKTKNGTVKIIITK